MSGLFRFRSAVWLMLIGCLSFIPAEEQRHHRKAHKERTPNFIFILTDDLGWSSLSLRMDDRVPDARSDFHETPQMERLAARSLRFTRGYSPDPICSPTRRSLQFGQSSIRHDDDPFIERYAPRPDLPWKTIPQVLKSIQPRYRAAHFGKWDLRNGKGPEQYGYDEGDGNTGNGQGNVVSGKEEKWTTHTTRDNAKQTDSLTIRAIDFMRRQHRDGMPFYLQVSHYATHANIETSAASLARFEGKARGKKHDNPAWAGMLFDLDRAVGRLLDELDRLGLSDNTYVILMADNGGVEFIPPVSNRLDHPEKFSKPMRNAPLRGGKWTLYEGGIRVPFMVAGPGIKPGQTDVQAIGWDILPTITQLAGGDPATLKDLDGGSLVPVLHGRPNAAVKRSTDALFFHRFHKGYGHSAIIQGNHKLIHFWKSGKTELYDLSKDPGELRDLAKAEPDRTESLYDNLMRYIQRVNPALER